MAKRHPKLQTVKASEARQHFSELVNNVFRGETRILVEKSGIPVAAIISARDLEWLRQQEARQEEDFKILETIGAAFEDVPDEELERDVAKAVAEAREELWQERLKNQG